MAPLTFQWGDRLLQVSPASSSSFAPTVLFSPPKPRNCVSTRVSIEFRAFPGPQKHKDPKGSRAACAVTVSGGLGLQVTYRKVHHQDGSKPHRRQWALLAPSLQSATPCVCWLIARKVLGLDFFDTFFNTIKRIPFELGHAHDRNGLRIGPPAAYGRHRTSLPGVGVGRCARRGPWDKPFGVPMGNGPDQIGHPTLPPRPSNNSPTDSLICLDPGCGDIRAGEFRQEGFRRIRRGASVSVDPA